MKVHPFDGAQVDRAVVQQVVGRLRRLDLDKQAPLGLGPPLVHPFSERFVPQSFIQLLLF